MKQLQAFSLCAIAVALLAQVSLSEVWPRLYLRMTAPAYLDSMIVCLRAQDAAQRAEDIRGSLPNDEQHFLRLTARVGLLECRERDRLRAALAANGVDQHQLWLIELDALGHSSVSLATTVQDYRP